MIVAAFRRLLLLFGLLPLVGQAQDASARKADSLFNVWCDTTVERYPRTIALARFFGIDSSVTEDQASRLARNGTLPGLSERERQYQLAFAWHARGTDLGWRARTDEALAAFAQATRIFEELGDRNGIIGTECYKADLYLARGMLSEAVITMQPAAQAYLLMGDSMAAVDALWTIANALGSQGTVAAADREYRRALGLIAPGQQFRRFSWLSELAGFHARAGNTDTALVLVAQAQALGHGLPLDVVLPLLVTEARTYLLRGNCNNARQLLQEHAGPMNHEMGWRDNTRSDLLTVLAEACLCLEQPPRGKDPRHGRISHGRTHRPCPLDRGRLARSGQRTRAPWRYTQRSGLHQTLSHHPGGHYQRHISYDG